MKKVAFLFLTMDDPHFTNLWDEYLKGNSDKYNIYIHPKYPENVTWNKKHIIKNLQETKWGFIVNAYYQMLHAAYYDDVSNYKFVTISESCVPIKSFDKFYAGATNDSKSWVKFMDISNYDRKARIDVQPKTNKPHTFIKHYARFCLNRAHVKELLTKLEPLHFFYNMHVGDEFFLSVMRNIKNEARDFAVTHDDWEYVRDKVKKLKNKKKKLYELQESKNIDCSQKLLELTNIINDISKNPKTIVDVAKVDLINISNTSSFFYRKFSKDSNITKYWSSIINKTIITT